MTKTHTAQSLGKYLGMKIQIRDGLIAILASLSINFPVLGLEIKNEKGEDELWEGHPLEDEVYPILKDYTQLIEPMEFEWEMIVPIEYIYGSKISIGPDFTDAFDNPILSIEQGVKLLELGFGAIESKESPTGWVSVFDDLPCVNAKEV